MTDTSYRGFGPKALPFLKALAFHQNKEWFEENRDLYESEVNEPRCRLVDDLAAQFKKAGLPLTGNRKSSVFRINRDVRFSKDKSPYKTNVSAVLTRSGAKNDPGLIYFHVQPDNCFFGAGFYHPDGEEMRAFREAIVARKDAFFNAVAPLQKLGFSFIDSDALKRMPRGFEEVSDPELGQILRLKHFALRKPFDATRLEGRALVDDITELAKASLPFLEFGWRVLDPIRSSREDAERK